MNTDMTVIQSLLNKGHAALWDHDWEEAVAAYSEALVESPDHPVGLASLGLAYFHQKRYSESMEIFQQLSEKDPGDPMPMERISRIHERQGLLQEAVSSYNRAAELQLKSRDVDRAMADYQEILRLDPENQEARTRLAMIYNRLGRNREAVIEFLDLAAVVQHAGNPTKALQVLEYAQKIKPDSIDIKNAFVTINNGQALGLLERKADRTGALRMAQVREMDGGEENDCGSSTDPITEARQVALKEIAGLLFEDGENQTAKDILSSLSEGSDLSIESQLDRTVDRRTAAVPLADPHLPAGRSALPRALHSRPRGELRPDLDRPRRLQPRPPPSPAPPRGHGHRGLSATLQPRARPTCGGRRCDLY